MESNEYEMNDGERKERRIARSAALQSFDLVSNQTGTFFCFGAGPISIFMTFRISSGFLVAMPG